MESAHRHHLRAESLGAFGGVVQSGGRVVGAVVADNQSRRLTAVASRGETQLSVHGPTLDDEHRAVGLVEQRVRRASECGPAKSPTTARPDRDLVRIQLPTRAR